MANLVLFQAKSGHGEPALAVLRPLLPSENGFVCYAAATVFEILGQRGQAIEQIRRALARGYSIQEVAHDPELTQLRQDPAFAKIQGD